MFEKKKNEKSYLGGLAALDIFIKFKQVSLTIDSSISDVRAIEQQFGVNLI